MGRGVCTSNRDWVCKPTQLMHGLGWRNSSSTCRCSGNGPGWFLRYSPAGQLQLGVVAASVQGHTWYPKAAFPMAQTTRPKLLPASLMRIGRVSCQAILSFSCVSYAAASAGVHQCEISRTSAAFASNHVFPHFSFRAAPTLCPRGSRSTTARRQPLDFHMSHSWLKPRGRREMSCGVEAGHTTRALDNGLGRVAQILLPVVCALVLFIPTPFEIDTEPIRGDGLPSSTLRMARFETPSGSQAELSASADPQYDHLVTKMRETSRSEAGQGTRGSASKCASTGTECTPGYGTKRTSESIRRDINKNLLLEAWDTVHRGGYGYPGWYDPNGGLFVAPDSFLPEERAEWVADPWVLDSRARTHDAIRRMVEDLHDPYSRFLSQEEFKLESHVPSTLEKAGRTNGVGLALFDPLDGKEDLVVVAPVPESPAEVAGIRPLDRVVAVDGLDVSAVHLTPDEGMSLLRGPQDSEVEIKIRAARNAVGSVGEGKDALGDRLPRQLTAWAEPEEQEGEGEAAGAGAGETSTRVKLKRRSLTVPPVRAGVIESPLHVDSEIEGMINGGQRPLRFGYVRINFFNRLGTEMLASALAQLEQQEVDGIIVDVRNCLGGLFKEALYAASMLLGEDDATLVRVIDSSGEVKKMTRAEQRSLERWPSTGGFPLAKPLELLRTKPLRVITNRGSASSSEVLAMALVGNGRGALIGERTFGKALIQHPYTLADGSVIKLTVAEYLSPRGEHLRRGLEPDDLCPAGPAPKASDQCVRQAQGAMARQGRAGALRFVGYSAQRAPGAQQGAGEGAAGAGEGRGTRQWWLWERSAVSAKDCCERYRELDLRQQLNLKPR